MNDVVNDKIQSIQLCVARAREEYAADAEHFDTNYTRQDAAVLNVIRACEQAIDLANHVIRSYKMGIPASSAESFEILQKKAVVESELADKLKKMVYFRNLVIHRYQKLELEIVKKVIVSGLDRELFEFLIRLLSNTGQDALNKGP
jgi:uncharacterized protein YutE (UPF0331/DUF86 family)